MENNLREGWIAIPFTELLDIQGGTQPPKNTFKYEPTKGYIRLLQIRDFGEKPHPTFIIEKPQLKTCEKDDILIARYGASIGRIVTGMSGAYNVALAKVVIPQPINKNFIKYLLKSEVFQKPILNIERSAQDGFNKDDLAEIEIPLPPLPEQHRIVEKLDAVIQKVVSNKQRLENIPIILKRFRQSVLAAAVNGILTEEWRGKKDRIEVNIGTLKKIRQKNHSDIGKNQKQLNKSVPKLPEFNVLENESLPDEWISISVESATTFIIDCLHSTPKFTETGNLCIDTTCIEPFKILYDSARKVTADSFNERTSRMTPEKDDILFSREGTIGTAVLYNGEFPICLGQRMMMFRFADFVLPKYAEIYMASFYFKSLYTPFILGTSAQHLNIGDVRQLEFVLPSIEEQKEIIRRVAQLFAFADKLEARYAKAKTMIDKLPQSILAKAFRGELVSQNPNDEPASVLLERIKKEKEKLEAEKKDRKSKAYSIEEKPLRVAAEGKVKYKKAAAREV